MSGSILWKLGISVLVFIWAITTLTPLTDTPFEQYIQEQATGEIQEFQALYERAAQRVEANEAPSVYVALGDIAQAEKIDLAKFFPQFNFDAIRNLEKRNDAVLSSLLRASQGELRPGLDLAGGVSVTFRAEESDLSSDSFQRADELEKARSIIAQRVDSLGVAEPSIRVVGSDRIEVQMPGVTTKDNPNIIDTIGRPAILEFSLVHRTADPRMTPEAPVGYRLMIEEREDSHGNIIEQPYYIRNLPVMTGSAIEEANAVVDPYGQYRVILNFTKEGAEQFEQVTRQIVEENQRTGTIGQLAIILDNELYSAPSVQTVIGGGRAEITGRFTQLEARDLANVLNNPLEVGLVVDEMYEIGPSLAADARDSSIKAAVIGSALVLAFMVLYYWGSGVIAMIAVAFNVLWVLAWLAYFGATITLPGVAALVLTIGMAVDANILILERMREELAAGKSNYNALLAGFDKAFSTIVDANVTTLITAALLAWLGTGPIKGFGITLAIGIFGTLFSALIVSRWMMEWPVQKGLVKRLLGLQLARETNFAFLDYRKPAFIGSWIIVILGLVAVFSHRSEILGIDFTGGDEITLAYNEQVPVTQIQNLASVSESQLEALLAATPENDAALRQSLQTVIKDGGFGEVNTVVQSGIGTDEMSLRVQTGPGEGPAFAALLLKEFPNAGLEVMSLTQVGPSVGAEVATSAIWSLTLALLGILLYVAIRFEWGFGIGALVSTVHDALLTVGLFVVLGQFFGIGSGQFNASMIAAILMVLGYSINDTIVIFDRIREELDLNPSLDLRKVIHLAINRTLPRTILTSVTTLLATLALYIFAAGVIVDFALVFLIGIVVGAFSSLFIACPVFYWYHKGDRRKVAEHHVLPTYSWHVGEQEATKSPSKG